MNPEEKSLFEFLTENKIVDIEIDHQRGYINILSENGEKVEIVSLENNIAVFHE